MAQLFDYRDYIEYVSKALEELSKARRGIKSQFAEAIQCTPSYVTRVLSSEAHLNLEQAGRANGFLGHTDDQSLYFILLVEHARAGTKEVKEIFARQIKKQQRDYLNLKTKFGNPDAIAAADQNIFYSSWQYAAIYVALTVPRLQTKEALSTHFQLPLKRVSEMLHFLSSIGLVREERGKLKCIAKSFHLTGDPSIQMRDHMNWRHAAIRAYETVGANDLHYTSVVALSEEDVLRIKRKLLDMLEEARTVIRDSKEEVVYSFLLDFFQI